MSFRDGENSDLTSENMEQEEKIKIEETSINLGYVKKELENEEPEFQENQYKIISNFENIFQKNNGDSLIDFLDDDAIMKAESVKVENVKEENKDHIQQTAEQSLRIKLEIIQCHCCNVLFEEWEHLEYHMLHCHNEKYNRLYDNKLDIQQKSANDVEETQGNGEISTIDDNRSSLTLTEIIGSKYADGISQTCKEGSANEKKHKCSKCSYQTDKIGHLKQHLNIHNKIKAFECEICKKRFNRKCNLETHIMNIHSNTNEKKFKCTECSYQTIYKCNLMIHFNIHNEMKPLECDICKKIFKQKKYLKKHILNIHSNTNEKGYKCIECSYQTNRQDQLKQHLNVHTKCFECDICKKIFTRKDHLKTHIQIHLNTNEKNYKCTECSYQTIYKQCLKIHLNVHNNIKPFECDICNKRFNAKGNLTEHIMVKHSNSIEKKYKCTECSYQTNVKHHLKSHLNTHLPRSSVKTDI